MKTEGFHALAGVFKVSCIESKELRAAMALDELCARRRRRMAEQLVSAIMDTVQVRTEVNERGELVAYGELSVLIPPGTVNPKLVWAFNPVTVVKGHLPAEASDG